MLIEKQHFFNRDISWLSFNACVLDVASDDTLPLYERIKFLAIFSSNLDEFFRVRVALLLQNMLLPEREKHSRNALKQIHQIVGQQQEHFGKILKKGIIPELKNNGILLIQHEIFLNPHQVFAEKYFNEFIMHQLEPVLISKKSPRPFLQNGAIYLAIEMHVKPKNKQKESEKKRRYYAMVKIPAGAERFVKLPKVNQKNYIAFADDVIRANLHKVFVNYVIVATYSFKISRNADLFLEDETGSVVERIEKNLKKRETGEPSRFLYDEQMPKHMLHYFVSFFGITKENEIISGGRYHRLADFFNLPNPLYPELMHIHPAPLPLKSIDNFDNLFSAIKQQDWLLHFPYQSFKYIILLLRQAAFDTKVYDIKATIYRVAHDSAIVNALIAASRNGKKVTVFVEVKARFDEESNIYFADKMKKAGIHIIYSHNKLKVHAKACLITRKSSNKKGIRQYACLSTGNFNEKTAKQYSDDCLLTTKPAYCREVEALFNYIQTWKKGKNQFKNLLITGFNMVETYVKHIENEIAHAKNGKKASILLKVNNLEDEAMIRLLYKASQAGVMVNIIVRGICRCIPEMPYSKNINLIRLVGKYLEHSRIVVFYNSGDEKIYYASADWMKRNLHHRVELGFPITNPAMKKEVLQLLDFQLNDNQNAHRIDKQLQNIKPQNTNLPPLQAQVVSYHYLKDKNH